MADFIFRNATVADVPFLAKTIIEAEKSGSDKLTYSTVLGLTEEEALQYISEMPLEEVDGCELSISSFLIAERDGHPAATVSAWIEGKTGVSSSILKANLLQYILPESCFLNLREINSVIRELHIDYIHNTIQIGSGFVDSDYRGQRLSARIIDELIDRLRRSDPDVNEAYIQIFSCNIPSLRSSVNQGFKTVLERESLNHEILKYLPSNKKFLVRKELCS
jgi:hypothetical protein